MSVDIDSAAVGSDARLAGHLPGGHVVRVPRLHGPVVLDIRIDHGAAARVYGDQTRSGPRLQRRRVSRIEVRSDARPGAPRILRELPGLVRKDGHCDAAGAEERVEGRSRPSPSPPGEARPELLRFPVCGLLGPRDASPARLAAVLGLLFEPLLPLLCLLGLLLDGDVVARTRLHAGHGAPETRFRCAETDLRPHVHTEALEGDPAFHARLIVRVVDLRSTAHGPRFESTRQRLLKSFSEQGTLLFWRAAMKLNARVCRSVGVVALRSVGVAVRPRRAIIGGPRLIPSGKISQESQRYRVREPLQERDVIVANRDACTLPRSRFTIRCRRSVPKRAQSASAAAVP